MIVLVEGLDRLFSELLRLPFGVYLMQTSPLYSKVICFLMSLCFCFGAVYFTLAVLILQKLDRVVN
jgi:hypothetical protein